MDTRSDSVEEKKSYEGAFPYTQWEDVEKVPTKKDGDDELPWYQQRKLSSSKSDPFGDEGDSEVKYKTMAWWQAYMIMTAETVSLGILSLPSVLAAIGMVPGIILIAALGVLAT